MYNEDGQRAEAEQELSSGEGLFAGSATNSEVTATTQVADDARNRTLAGSPNVAPVHTASLGFGSEVERVIVIYKDKSFESFNPR